jgi:hypothetical protein
MNAEELHAELEALCAEWQKRLRIQDWIITLVVNYDSSTCGSCTTCKSRKLATITVAHPDCNTHENDKDYEATLVHELLHVHAAGFDGLLEEDSAERMAYEQMIDLVSYALVKGRRNEAG